MSLEGVVDKLVLPNNILKIQPAWSRSNGNIHAMIRVAAFFLSKSAQIHSQRASPLKRRVQSSQAEISARTARKNAVLRGFESMHESRCIYLRVIIHSKHGKSWPLTCRFIFRLPRMVFPALGAILFKSCAPSRVGCSPLLKWKTHFAAWRKCLNTQGLES
jgi:hypothetical protein